MVMDSVRHYYSSCVEVLRKTMKIVRQFQEGDCNFESTNVRETVIQVTRESSF